MSVRVTAPEYVRGTVGGVDPQWFDGPVESVTCEACDGGAIVRVTYERGGVWEVYTDTPFLFVEPERH